MTNRDNKTPQAGQCGGLPSLAEAIGAVLDKHVGWQMHRGQMIEDLCEVATSPALNPDGAKAIVEMLKDYKRRTGLRTLGL